VGRGHVSIELKFVERTTVREWHSSMSIRHSSVQCIGIGQLKRVQSAELTASSVVQLGRCGECGIHIAYAHDCNEANCHDGIEVFAWVR